MNRRSSIYTSTFITVVGLLFGYWVMPTSAATNCPQLSRGAHFKTDAAASVWQLGADGYIRYYPHSSVYFSRNTSHIWIVTIPTACFSNYSLAPRAPYGINYPENTLIKLIESPDVYVVGKDETISKIQDSQTAERLWGNNWSKKVKDVAAPFWINYRVSNEQIAESSEPRVPVVTPTPPSATATEHISAVWAHDGGEKIVRNEMRGITNNASTKNTVWDGSQISLFGAKNEIVSANLVLESGVKTLSDISVEMTDLVGPGSIRIESQPLETSSIFDWTDGDVELFFVRYLEIKGLSAFCCQTYDERHVPEAFRRPHDSNTGIGSGTWTDRPHHNAEYPEIAVPLVLAQPFEIQKGNNQSIWVDVYVDKKKPAGIYTGTILVKQHGNAIANIPISVEVKNFVLPDTVESKTMIPIGAGNVNMRFFGEAYPNDPTKVAASKEIIDTYYQMAHRHGISLIDDDMDNVNDHPGEEWMSRLNGSLYSAQHKYKGPREGFGNDLFVVGLYGSWPWRGEGKESMWKRTDNWEQWFLQNAPQTERFLYLIDESLDYNQTQKWAVWMDENPGVGRNLSSMATVWVLDALASIPNLDVIASTMFVAPREETQAAVDQIRNDNSKHIYFYNGGRPGQGSFMTEDDGVALRVVAWTQYKKNIDRWFYWNSTYYDNYQAGEGQTDLFSDAHTFGSVSQTDVEKGESGWNYSNGDGVLLYPGTDRVFPSSSYGVDGPIASLRLKHWRRGIQDVAYLQMAMKKDPIKTQEVIDRVIPKVLWEPGVQDLSDPTWIRTSVSWSSDPDVWENARRELANIISG